MPLSIQSTTDRPSTVDADLLILPVREGESLPDSLSSAFSREVSSTLKSLQFSATWGSSEMFVAPRGVKAEFVAVVGMGDPKNPAEKQAEGLRRGLGKIVLEARRHVLQSAVVVLSGESPVGLFAGAAAEAAYLTTYSFLEYKSSQAAAKRSLKKMILAVSEDDMKEVKQVLKRVKETMKGVDLTRDLVNRPAQDVSPRILVDVAKDIASTSESVTLKTLNRDEADKANFKAFLAVARGSTEEPYVIHLTYTPKKKTSDKKIVLVGKGITFDSGGLSLKPADYMETMKTDMAGAATVLGTFAALEKIQPGVEVHGVIATCENMPSGNAYRPGDVLRAMNGKTIEVLNTDAEGRITLADALSYSVKMKPDVIVDLATLTGAVVMALGETHAGVWSNTEAVADSLVAASRQAGEGLETMPLPEEYRGLIESRIADIRNTATSRWGGAITAALFLQEFVSDVPWAHLDIAAPAHADRSLISYWQPGATGYGVRTLLNYLEAVSNV